MPYFLEASSGLNEFLDSESSTESQVYAGHLLTIISVILTVTAVVISIVGIAIYSGLQTHFRGKVKEVEDRLKSTFDELLGEAEIRSHKIVDKKERELHDFERTRLNMSSALVALELSYREWKIIECIQIQKHPETNALYEEFKSLLRAYTHTEYAHIRLDQAEESLEDAKSAGKNIDSTDETIWHLRVKAANNSIFFLACIFQPRFKEMLCEIQSAGSIGDSYDVRHKVTKLKLILEKFSNQEMEKQKEKSDFEEPWRIYHADSLLFADWAFEMADEARLKQRATDLIDLVRNLGDEKFLEKLQRRYEVLLKA